MMSRYCGRKYDTKRKNIDRLEEKNNERMMDK